MRFVSLFITMLFLAGCNLGAPGDITPVPTLDMPTVEVLSPTNNQQVIVGIEFDFDIVARDSGDGVALVELYVDEILVNSSSPVEESAVPIFRTTMNWRASGIGLHIIEIIAYREDGRQSDPQRLTIEVVPRDA